MFFSGSSSRSRVKSTDTISQRRRFESAHVFFVHLVVCCITRVIAINVCAYTHVCENATNTRWPSFPAGTASLLGCGFREFPARRGGRFASARASSTGRRGRVIMHEICTRPLVSCTRTAGTVHAGTTRYNSRGALKRIHKLFTYSCGCSAPRVEPPPRTLQIYVIVQTRPTGIIIKRSSDRAAHRSRYPAAVATAQTAPRASFAARCSEGTRSRPTICFTYIVGE